MPPGEVPGERPGRRRGGLAWLSVLVGAAVVGAGVWLVVDRWDELGPALAALGWAATAGALALTVLGVVATGECWRTWLAALGGRPAPAVAHRVFYVTQAGKYVPGSLWPVLAQAALARRYGMGRAVVVTASTLFLLLHTGTGVVVGALVIGGLDLGAALTTLLVAAAVAAVLVLAPPVLRRLLAVVARTGRVAPGTAPGWGDTARATAWLLAAWACYGAATWLLLVPLVPDDARGVGTVVLAVGGYALAWVVGFLAVAAPAGIGAREAVLVAVLAPAVGVTAALAVALVSRAVLTVADLGLAAASSGVLARGSAG